MPKKPSIAQLEKTIKNLNNELDASLAASAETDSNFYTGGMSSLYAGRHEWDRRKIFSEAMRAWRVNPIARRIVRLERSFIIGKGIAIKSDDIAEQDYLNSWWNHPLNKMHKNVKRWIDENTRVGNLFILCTIGEASMLYPRAIPAEFITEIICAPNDIEQELSYNIDENSGLGLDNIEAYDPNKQQSQFIIHFASNAPVGSPWGESDFAPLLIWIGRYASWLEDRVRLNRFRTSFNYIVQMLNATEEQRRKRQTEINQNPPKQGQVLVTTPAEQWGVMSAQLDSFDASVDGLAIKKMIAGGKGYPLHFLAEPESATRTTAEAAGTPTFRTLEEEQEEFFEWIVELAQIALKVAGKPESKTIYVEGPDITEKDNASLALALSRIYPALAEHFDREGIEAEEFNRIVYSFMARVQPKDQKANTKRKPLVEKSEPSSPADPSDPKTDPADPEEE